MRLSPEVEDALDLHGASSEMLEVWAARQEHLNAESTGLARAPMHEAARAGCLKFLQSIAGVFGQSDSGWLQAAAIFDLYCARSRMPEDELIAQAPAVCIAIIRTCVKVERSNMGRRLYTDFQARKIARLFDVMGHPADACSDESVNSAEKRLLEMLDWDLRVPSLEMWMSFLYRRFNVITRGIFSQPLSGAQEHCRACARIVVCHERHGGDGFCTRRMAEGIVACTLANAGAIPWDSFRPQGYSAEDWQGLLQRCQPAVALTECSLEEPRLSLVLQILVHVCGRDLEALRESCALALEAIDSATHAASQ